MKFSKILASAFALTLLFNISCRNDDPIVETPKGAYENGIIIANEGGFSTPTSTVAFLSNDLATSEENIFGKNNNNEILGNVFQTIGFKGDLAYLVLNVPNKVEIVNRYSFKKTSTITANLDNPRYIAFSGNNTYITNNDFFSVRKVNIYDNANQFVKSIDFPRYAEKITASNGFVYVQTDGIAYNPPAYEPEATGHTITRINPATNNVDQTITLDDNLMIKDMISDANFVYVITSDNTTSNLFKITSATGSVEKISLAGISGASKLAMDQNKLYFLTSDKKVYTMTGNAPTSLFTATTRNVYGFSVIDGNVYVSDPSFSSDSITRIYSSTGTLLKTLNTGIGTNGFYKN